jgi:hypothetical protein
MGAEATAKELPRLGLADALELALLIARKKPRRHPRDAAAGYCAKAATLEDQRGCVRLVQVPMGRGLAEWLLSSGIVTLRPGPFAPALEGGTALRDRTQETTTRGFGS